jgi:hypothetical protein
MERHCAEKEDEDAEVGGTWYDAGNVSLSTVVSPSI